ncbi:MAG TPA: hypothetical protein VND45_14620 [Thermoanaerobaculia bacterium]|nr:hypothetical protein [Thermoanaerobaculia bacterium]
MTLVGCVLTFLVIGGAMFLFAASFRLLWWGRGFVGAMEARHAPERVRASSTLYIYDTVIEVERDRVVFRRSLWAPLRAALLAGLGAAIVTFVIRARRPARRWMLAAALIAGALTFVISHSGDASVTVPRGTKGRVEVQSYVNVIGGGTKRATVEDEADFHIVLVEDTRTTRLVQVPSNASDDANIWRGLIEEKLRP